MNSTPIYHQVCEDLGIFPLAMKVRTHEQFMREHEHTEWLARVMSPTPPVAVKRAAAKRPARKPRKR